MNQLAYVLDPELVIPSAEHETRLAFWNRMWRWVDDSEWRIGPSTYAALVELMNAPPSVEHLSSSDFWSLVGRLASRVFEPSSEERNLCEDHLPVHYAPSWGELQNPRRLRDDLAAVGPAPQVALGTVPDCWSLEAKECERCAAQRLHRVHGENNDEYEDAIAKAWRASYVDAYPASANQLPKYAEVMFPRIQFSEVAWNGLSSLVGEGRDLVSGLVKHLGVLNDHAGRVWREQASAGDRQAELGSLGVDASPESPQTRRNSSAIKQRDFDFEGEKIRCEWHSKLRPDANRIHFAVDGDTVQVGIIIDHLPL